MTFAGGAAGAKFLGRAAGKLDDAARLRGPRYGTSADDLRGMAGDDPMAKRRVEQLLRGDQSKAILHEVPPGSTLLGAGAEGIGLATPEGDVLRLGRAYADQPGRVVSDHVAQATRSVKSPIGPDYVTTAERVPRARDVGSRSLRKTPESHWLNSGETGQLNARLKAEGLDFTDPFPDNVGRIGGRSVVIDPGAVTPGPSFTGGYQPATDLSESQGPLMGALLRGLGSDRRMRRSLAAGGNSAGFAQSGRRLGGALGALTPTYLGASDDR